METKFFQPPAVYTEVVDLNVVDLNRSVEFYTGVLGLRVWEKEENRVIFTAGGDRPLLAVHQTGHIRKRNPRASGLYHFALLVPTEKDLADILNHLRKKRIPLGASDHLVSEALYLQDPDGNGIEIYRDRLSSSWTRTSGRIDMAVDPLDGDRLLAMVDGYEWDGIPEGTIIGHVHLHVVHLEESRRFYCAGLGFDVMEDRMDKALFISSHGYHHHIGLNTWKGEGIQRIESGEQGLRSFTLCYPDEERLAEVVNRLEHLGYQPAAGESGGWSVADPSGLSIKLKSE